MIDRLPLDAVIFDAGGTLVRLDFEWISQMLAGLDARVTIEALRRGEIHGRRLYDEAVLAAGASGGRPGQSTNGGPAPIDVYWSGMLQAAGCPPARLRDAVERLAQRQRSDHFLWARPMEGAREVLDALAARRFRLACVSNSDGRAEAHLTRYGLRAGLEFVIDSALVGVEKPDPRIFGLALERLGVRPDRALYVGDIRSVDELGSSAAGMRFVLLDPAGDYAHPDTARIAALGELPDFVADHFIPPGPDRDGGA